MQFFQQFLVSGGRKLLKFIALVVAGMAIIFFTSPDFWWSQLLFFVVIGNLIYLIFTIIFRSQSVSLFVSGALSVYLISVFYHVNYPWYVVGFITVWTIIFFLARVIYQRVITKISG